MSLGISDMAGSALGTASSLLLLASIIQGLQGVEVFHYKKMVVLEGQDVALPCSVKNITGVHIGSIEWRMNETTKLALYHPTHGINPFWPNVSIKTDNESMGPYLQLYGVTPLYSGVYTCDLTLFPQGSIWRETVLEIKALKITCDVNSTVEVQTGENVTIHCGALPDAEYSWTKNKTLVSGDKSLELWRVTDADTGVYTLTVNTGNRSLHEDFIITVLKQTTSLSTVSPHSHETESMTRPADHGHTSSPTTGPPNTESNVTLNTGVTEENPDPSNVTTSFTDFTHNNVTSGPVTFTEPDHLNNSGNHEMDVTHSFDATTSSDQSVASNLSTALNSTQDMIDESVEIFTENFLNPDATPTETTGNTVVMEDEGTDGVRSHWLLALIVVITLISIALAGVLYRRYMIRKSMDLPPPFKPPPPPVKYTAARRHETFTQPFPTSRCNSVTEPKDMQQMFIQI